jgi:hypothetical protein
MSTGSIVGGILGGIGGATIGQPQLGFAVGSGIGGAIEGQSKWKKAQGMNIDSVDPRMQLLLNEIQQKRRSLEAGTMYRTQQDAIRSMGAGAMRRATSATGGDIGSLVQALNLINRGTGRNLNELYGTMAQQSLNMIPLEGQYGIDAANRKYQVQAYDKQQAMGHSARVTQNAMSSLYGAIGSERTGAVIDNIMNTWKQKRALRDKDVDIDGFSQGLNNVFAPISYTGQKGR